MKKIKLITPIITSAVIAACTPCIVNCGGDGKDTKIKITLDLNDKVFYKDSLDLVKDKEYEITINYTANLWDHDGKLFYVSDSTHIDPINCIDPNSVYGTDSEGDLGIGVVMAKPGAAEINFSKDDGITRDQIIKIYCKFTSNQTNASIVLG